jgi:hypothetical protein
MKKINTYEYSNALERCYAKAIRKIFHRHKEEIIREMAYNVSEEKIGSSEFANWIKSDKFVDKKIKSVHS